MQREELGVGLNSLDERWCCLNSVAAAQWRVGADLKGAQEED